MSKCKFMIEIKNKIKIKTDLVKNKILIIK